MDSVNASSTKQEVPNSSPMHAFRLSRPQLLGTGLLLGDDIEKFCYEQTNCPDPECQKNATASLNHLYIN